MTNTEFIHRCLVIGWIIGTFLVIIGCTILAATGYDQWGAPIGAMIIPGLLTLVYMFSSL